MEPIMGAELLGLIIKNKIYHFVNSSPLDLSWPRFYFWHQKLHISNHLKILFSKAETVLWNTVKWSCIINILQKYEEV